MKGGLILFFIGQGLKFSAPVEPIERVTMSYTSNTKLIVT